jgi:hexosaminidase
MIGWDEILEGGLAPNASVMSWRGMEGGIQAAHEGHDVVMTPTSHCYFDYYQSADVNTEPPAIGGYLPLEKVYAFEPVPLGCTAEEAQHILGAQGNLWTEYISTPKHAGYMLFPRATALAEVVWSPAENRDFADFKQRLQAFLPILKMMGMNYRGN